MSELSLPPANFTISSPAARALERVKREHDLQFPDDPAAVLSVSWGFYMPNSPGAFENVVIGVYPRSMLDDVAHGIQEISGVKLIFFTSEDYQSKFAGKVLDHADERGFFLRSPD